MSDPAADLSRRILLDGIQRRRRSAMVALLGTFEREIEPLLPPGSQRAIDNFKGVVRKKINGMASEAQLIAETEGEQLISSQAADLVAELLDTEENEAT